MASNPSPYGGGGGVTGIIPPAGDIGGSTGTPTVTGEHFTSKQAVLNDLAGAMTANQVLAGNGSNITLRALAAADLPTVPITSGGTGQITQQAALDALAATQTSGQYLRGNGTHVAMSAVQAGDVPTLNQNTSGTAAGLSATLGIGSGGTGQATQQAALDALAATQTSGQYLRGNGTHVAMSAIQSADVPVPSGATNGWNSVYLAPAGALAETFPRYCALAVSAQPTSGSLYLTAIPLLAGQVVTNLNILIGTTQASVITNSWMVLLDSGLVVRAVTANNTSTVVSQAIWSLAAGATYTVPSSGLYYFGVMFNCTNKPTFMYTNVTNTTAIGGLIAPALAGVSSTAQTTPPSLGTTMAAIAPGASVTPTYAYVS